MPFAGLPFSAKCVYHKHVLNDASSCLIKEVKMHTIFFHCSNWHNADISQSYTLSQVHGGTTNYLFSLLHRAISRVNAQRVEKGRRKSNRMSSSLIPDKMWLWKDGALKDAAIKHWAFLSPPRHIKAPSTGSFKCSVNSHLIIREQYETISCRLFIWCRTFFPLTQCSQSLKSIQLELDFNYICASAYVRPCYWMFWDVQQDTLF